MFLKRILLSAGKFLIQHLLNHILAISTEMLLVFPGQLGYEDWFAVSQSHFRGANPWEMIFKNIGSAGQCHWDDRAAGFLCNLKGTFLERKKTVRMLLIFVAGALWENADRDTGIHLRDRSQDHFESLL